jgi:predicted MPP superfamily phosphohydrolase
VQVRHHRVTTPRWPAGAPPLRIAFASDLHAGPTTHASLLDDAFDRLAGARADVILLGGDYVFLDAGYISEIADRVRGLRAPLGIHAVMGNHDLWAEDDKIVRELAAAGARVLVNETVALAPHAVLAGLDDPWTGIAPVRPIFAPTDAARVVLVHAPEAMLYLRDEPFELALCGHTHGGHVALPGEVPVLVPGPLSRRYAHGRYDVGGDRALIVSRGVGASEVALRTFADPDILVVDLGP